MKRQKANKKIQNVVGNICCNCGETDHIEYHHIVPLALGGNDIESNIVPLCHVCHMAAHHGRNINHYFGSFNKGGRPSTATIEGDSHIFDMYINGKLVQHNTRNYKNDHVLYGSTWEIKNITPDAGKHYYGSAVDPQ